MKLFDFNVAHFISLQNLFLLKHGDLFISQLVYEASAIGCVTAASTRAQTQVHADVRIIYDTTLCALCD